MRKIIVTTFLSMDGVLQSPGGPEEDTTNGFKWGGWIAPHSDEQTMQSLSALMQSPFDLLLGRRTYEIFAAYWPYIKDHPVADKFNAINKYVVSGHTPELSWQNSTLITGDVVKGLRELKKQDGPDLLVHGSSVLVQTLLANGLADQLYLWTYPVTIGKGKRLFADGTQPGNWKLVESQISTTGVVIARYVPDSDIRLATAGPDNPSEAELKRRKR